MGTSSYADYLCSLDDVALADLLRERPDARAEPLPSSVARLASRLASAASVSAALVRLDRDALEVVRAIGVLGDHATPTTVMNLLDAPTGPVVGALDRLLRAGLIWPADGAAAADAVIGLVDGLRRFVHQELGGDGRIDHLARHVRVDELRALARAHDVSVDGLRKPEIVEALVEAFAHIHAVVARVRALPESHRARLRQGAEIGVVTTIDVHGRSGRLDAVTRGLLEAGMVVTTDRGMPAVPAEVAVARWLAEARLTGPPDLPGAAPADPSGTAGNAADAVRLVTTLLDRAAATPIPALKSGGVGKRERARLVKALELDDDGEVCLALDLVAGAGLLGLGPQGFTTTAAYQPWREGDLARRWATLAVAWWDLALPPTHRVEPDGNELAPPLTTSSPSTALRRAVLEIAGPDRSLTAVVEALDWHRPLDPEPPDRRDAVAVATADEAVRLGLAGGDAPSTLGAALASGADVDTLTTVAADHLVDEPGRLLLQSDLTAVVSGQPDAGLVRLLDTAADAESRGAATTYRFSPGSVRRALDAGWEAEEILERLRAVATTALPQPLEYLVGDVARRHGTIRVHETRACVVAEEALADELSAARSLRMLRWRRLAPTVLATHAEPPGVLSTLRDAGYSPVLDDGAGTVVVERTPPKPASPTSARLTRALLGPEEAVARLRSGAERAASTTDEQLAALNPRLDEAERELLADAVDSSAPVHLTYRSNSGGVTRRVVTPLGLHHRWIEAWCHLRDDERAFTVASILAVAPP